MGSEMCIRDSGKGEDAKHLYTVRYQGADLWGPSAEAGVVLNIDLFEPYLSGV